MKPDGLSEMIFIQKNKWFVLRIAIFLTVCGLLAACDPAPRTAENVSPPKPELFSGRTFTAPVASAPAFEGIWSIVNLADQRSPEFQDAPGKNTYQVRVASNRISGQLKCASFEGIYQTSEAGIFVKEVEVKPKQCAEPDVKQAARLAQILNDQRTRYQLEGDVLTFANSEFGETVWHLIPGTNGPPSNRDDILGIWFIHAINDKTVSTGTGDRTPAVFLDYFRIGIETGCNANGADIRWTDNGYSITSPFISTEIDCGPLTNQQETLLRILASTDLALSEGELTATSETGETITFVRPQSG